MTRTHNEPSVLIVGAGPSGLVLANELCRFGISLRIVDAADGPARESRALGIHARTLEIFDQMGIVEPFLKESRRLDFVMVYSDATPIRRFPLSGIDSPFPFVLSLPQRRTEELLLESLEQKGIAVEWNTALTDLMLDDDRVIAHLAGPEKEQELSFDFLVGCDGARSTVREKLGLGFSGAPIDTWLGVADVCLHGPLNPQGATVFFSPEGLLGFIPLPQADQFRLVFPLPRHPTHTAPLLDLEFLRHLVSERSGLEDIEIEQSLWSSSFQTGRSQVPNMLLGPVALAGDAAHLHSPVGGQGMNSGIQDVHNLAWKLALYLKGVVGRKALESYHEERHEVAKKILRSTQAATHAIATDRPLLNRLRNGAFRLLTSSKRMRTHLVSKASQTEFHYTHSPIVVRDIDKNLSTRGPAPGARAPDAVFSTKGRRLHELLRSPRHQLFWFALSSELLPQRLSELPGADYLHDKERSLLELHIFVRDEVPRRLWPSSVSIHRDETGIAHQLYNPEAQSLYLIRPDGHVALAARPAEPARVANFLDWFFDTHQIHPGATVDFLPRSGLYH